MELIKTGIASDIVCPHCKGKVDVETTSREDEFLLCYNKLAEHCPWCGKIIVITSTQTFQAGKL